jgi:hypothetical protein
MTQTRKKNKKKAKKTDESSVAASSVDQDSRKCRSKVKITIIHNYTVAVVQATEGYLVTASPTTRSPSGSTQR